MDSEEKELTCEEREEALKAKCKELEQALSKEIEFKKASAVLPNPQVLYVAAGNAYGFYKALLEASMYATSNSDYWRKILFSIDDSGQLHSPRLEGS